MNDEILEGQISFFDAPEKLRITKPIRLIELFAGIGAQAKALERLQADGFIPQGFEHYRICEFDKYAVKSYNAVHGTSFATSDITKIHAEDLGIVETDKFAYILVYSFPCQDISNAGLQRGFARGTGTRSGLLWEVERLLNECKELPQILVMENVPGVHSKSVKNGKSNMDHFQEWIASLEAMGYRSFWTDMNSKDYGVAQNRNRTFMISVLGNYSYKFPKPFKLEKRLYHYLDDVVDEKFYLSDETVRDMVSQMTSDASPTSLS